MFVVIVERFPESRGIFAQIRGEFATGITLGRYMIETEHGEIIIRNFSGVQASEHDLLGIHPHGFESGRTTHNLVVGGVPLPHVLSTWFSDNGRTSVNWPAQEAVVSGITLPVRSGSWSFGDTPSPWDRPLSFVGNYPPEDITLADSTRISFQPPHSWQLTFHQDGIWSLLSLDITVRHPGEEEYARYTSITFRRDWGDFISGEPFVEEE